MANLMDTSTNNPYLENFYTVIEAASYEFNTTANTTSATTASVLRLYDIFIPLFGFFIIILNLAVVISSGLILKKGQQPRSTYLFLGNVALSDLVTGIAVIFGQFYPRQYRDEISCSIQIGLIVSSTIASVYSVGLIAIDRYLYIVYGLKYQSWIYPNRARLLILLTWILAIVIGFLPTMGWRGDTDNGRICWFIVVAPPALVLLTTLVGMIPLVVIIVLYSIILYHAIKKVTQLKKAQENQAGAQAGNLRLFRGGRGSTMTLDNDNQLSETEEPLEPRNKFLRFFSRKSKPKDNSTLQTQTVSNKSPSRWKAIKVVMFTTGSFVITWVPYFIASTIYVFNCGDLEAETTMCTNLRVAIASPLAILGFMNSLFNPVIYAWWHNGFRETCKKMWFNMRPKTSQNESSVNTRQTTNSSSVNSPNVSVCENEIETGRTNTRSMNNRSQPPTTTVSIEGITEEDVSISPEPSTVVMHELDMKFSGQEFVNKTKEN